MITELDLENSLRHALEDNEFILYYQPKIDLNTNQITGFEALIRWHHPTKGLVYPGDFIDFAEKTGLIIPIGHWVFVTACNELKKLINNGYTNLSMSINLSAKQFKQNDLPDIIYRTINETGVDPHLIELEITETIIMENLDKAMEILDDVKKQGVRVSLDDFGIGY